MGDLLLTAEVVVSVLFGLLILLVLWVALRRWLITKNRLMILMAKRRRDLWVMGMAHTSADQIQWYPILGLSLRPRFVVARDEVELGPPLPAHRAPHILGDAVAVDCTIEGASEPAQFVLNRASYTQLRSWSESSPPGLNTGRY